MARRVARGVAVAVVALLALGLVGAYSLRLLQRARTHTASSTAGAIYQCAMHPQIVSHEPGNCPICGMRLLRVDEQAVSAVEHAPQAVSTNGDVPGHAAFVLPAERQQLIGVTRGKVETRPLEVEIHAAGRIAYDPALYQAVVEYREALRGAGAVGSTLPEASRGADAITRGARLKLRQLGLADAQIRDLAGRSADPVELLLPGDAAWIYAQVFEYEAPLVAPGQTMIATTPAYPGRTFSAKVVAVDPIVDPVTRTVRVRALVSTAGATLRPESFVDATILVALGDKLAVRREAVLDTGRRQMVFVVKGEGSFEPRTVVLGRAAGEHVEVLSGLASGEEVVTSANFLIDSESRFRAARAAFAGSGAIAPADVPAPPQHQH